MVELKLDNKSIIRGKRFLITQSSLRLLAGSEINTLELADYLQNQGASITVYTHFLSKPISIYFENKKIKVITDDKQLNIDDYDYVWVHHQTIPPSFIEKLSQGRAVQLPTFVFMHMSGLATHFLEQPHIWDLEKRIAAKVLFVSDETRDNIASNSLDVSKLDEGFYRNPTPIEFTRVEHMPSDNLRRVLVVSNHPPEEIIEAAILLRKKGIDVVMAGEGQKKYRLITADYLNGFDVVISIGKTVQYCLVANIPVYIYDVWGGPGYLDRENEGNAKWYNYSGRYFNKKNALTIVEEINNNYSAAIKYQSNNRDRYIKGYSMDCVIPSLMKDVKQRNITPFDPYYTQYATGALTMLKYKFYHENLLTKKEEELEKINKTLISIRERFRQNEIKYNELRNRMYEVENSESFRVGEIITRPARLLKHYINSKKN